MPAITHNLQYELFAQHYFRTRNPHEARDAAGFSPTYLARDLLKVPAIAERIQELLAPELEAAGITAQRVMRELSRVAFADIRDLFNSDGELIPVHQLGDDAAATISAIDVEVKWVGKGDDAVSVTTKKIRRVDKMAAVGILARHFKIVGEDNEGVNALASALADRLKAGRQRAFAPRATTPHPVEDARIIEPVQPGPATSPGPYQETVDDELWQ